LLGYRVATFLFVLGASFLLEPPRRSGLWVRGVLLAAISTVVTYYVFEQYLAVLLPRGSWTGF
jgi:putative tricarboxylic transport membrane protein